MDGTAWHHDYSGTRPFALLVYRPKGIQFAVECHERNGELRDRTLWRNAVVPLFSGYGPTQGVPLRE